MTESRQSVPGSARPALSSPATPLAPTHRAQATLVLRRRTPLEVGETPLSPAELADRHGADPDDVTRITRALSAHGIDVLDTHAASRRIRVEGTVEALSALFGTTLHAGQQPGQTRAREGALSIPADLDGVVAVLGLDDRNTASTRHIVAPASARTSSFTPLQLADIYALPEADGHGQTIAIIELGGGFSKTDLDHYFKSLGLATPHVSAKGVDGAKNVPGKDPQGADGEVLLDIQVAGAIAPKAAVVVYFAPNSDDGFVDAIATAAHATPTPAAISISWGQSEDQWTGQARDAMDQAMADAAALGITVTAAAGDNGSSDDPRGGTGKHADFPSSSPHALGCGGTRLEVAGDTVTETVWNDGGQGGATGGGISDTFPAPAWQQTLRLKGRGVPDVAGNADPQTGYQVYVDGQAMVIGGTSAVAPLWAGIAARLAQLSGKPTGLLQTRLYAGAKPGSPSPALRDITTGSNGAYHAAKGWDPCTGVGVPSAGLAKL